MAKKLVSPTESQRKHAERALQRLRQGQLCLPTYQAAALVAHVADLEDELEYFQEKAEELAAELIERTVRE